MSLEHGIPNYCINHTSCTVMIVPKSCHKIKMVADEIAYIGIGINNGQRNSICYLKFCDMDGAKYVVEDIMGNRFAYDRTNIIAYIPLPTKRPDNEKQHTLIIQGTIESEKYDMKCYCCNSDASEYLMYIEDGVKKCTAVCNNLCGSYFERKTANLDCVECGGSTGLFKQKWTSFQNDDMKRIVRFRYCHGSAECLDNIMTKFQKVVGSELLHKCENCGKSGTENTLKKCGKCLTIKYCGKNCQISNWPVHKALCKTISK